MNLTITYHQAVQAGACVTSLDQMRDSDVIGGDWGRYGRDRTFPLTAVLDALGLRDAIWILHALGEGKLLRLYASDCAAHVHHIFAADQPDDGRPAEAIRVARLSETGAIVDDAAAEHAGEAALYASDGAAASAAWAAAASANGHDAMTAAWVAAEHAASASSWDKARDADMTDAWTSAREWQTNHLRQILTGDVAPGQVEVTR